MNETRRALLIKVQSCDVWLPIDDYYDNLCLSYKIKITVNGKKGTYDWMQHDQLEKQLQGREKNHLITIKLF